MTLKDGYRGMYAISHDTLFEYVGYPKHWQYNSLGPDYGGFPSSNEIDRWGAEVYEGNEVFSSRKVQL